LSLVSDVDERLSFAEVFEVCSELLDAVTHEFLILLSTMRGEQHIFHFPEWALLRKWFNLEDIKDSTCNFFFLKSLNQICLVHSWSSSNVHEDRSLLHLGEG